MRKVLTVAILKKKNWVFGEAEEVNGRRGSGQLKLFTYYIKKKKF